MTTTKPVNSAQLQAEALAVSGSPNTHVELTLVGVAPDSTGICPAGGTLLCSDVAHSSATQEPCSFCVTAYNAHTAAPTPVPDPLKSYRDALSAAAASDPGLTTDTKTALNNLLAAMAPR